MHIHIYTLPMRGLALSQLAIFDACMVHYQVPIYALPGYVGSLIYTKVLYPNSFDLLCFSSVFGYFSFAISFLIMISHSLSYVVLDWAAWRKNELILETTMVYFSLFAVLRF